MLIARPEHFRLTEGQAEQLAGFLAEYERLVKYETHIKRIARENGRQGGRKPWKQDEKNRKRRETRQQKKERYDGNSSEGESETI